MYRKRLKSKTGCDRCRLRRIKCDETRPICRRCGNQNLNCNWTAAEGIDDARPKNALTSREIPVRRVPPIVHRAPTNGYQPFESETQFILVTNAISYICGMVRPGVVPDFSVLITCSLQQEWIRPALAAYGAIINTRTSTLSEPLGSGSNSYAKACLNLRHHVTSFDRHESAESLSCLTAATFLGLYEGAVIAPSLPTFLHFSGVAHMIVQCQWLEQDSLWIPFIRFATEMSLFNISWLCLFHSHCDESLRTLDTSRLRHFLTPTPPNVLPQANSPLVGGIHDVLILRLQIILFCREPNSLPDRRRRANDLFSQLDVMKAIFAPDLPGSTQSEVRNLKQFVILILSCLRVMLKKAMDCELSSSHISILEEVLPALTNLINLDMGFRRNSGLIWPALILLLAVDDLDSFNKLRQKSRAIALSITPPHCSWLSKAWDRIEMHRQIPNDHVWRDGLSLLTRPKGLLED